MAENDQFSMAFYKPIKLIRRFIGIYRISGEKRLTSVLIVQDLRKDFADFLVLKFLEIQTSREMRLKP